MLRVCIQLAFSAVFMVSALMISTSSGLANGYSVGDTSGSLYVQGYAKFARGNFGEDQTGGPNSCQAGQHINETLWFFSKASQPVPQGGSTTTTWLEEGFMRGINLGNPNNAGCDQGYYYENHPIANGGAWHRYIPIGVTKTTNDYWIRFSDPTRIGSKGMYAIIDSTVNQVFQNQNCCSNDINVGLEVSHPDALWTSATIDDTPVAYYDLNWIVHNWSGCTVNGFPNNCSRQDAGFSGHWVTVWNDYQNSRP